MRFFDENTISEYIKYTFFQENSNGVIVEITNKNFHISNHFIENGWKSICSTNSNIDVEHIDFLSIDTGDEIEVLRTINIERHKPKIILLKSENTRNSFDEFMMTIGYTISKHMRCYYVFSRSKYYAQFGEDKLIEKYFENEYIGGCIDVGASNGICLSNTKYFEEKGWYCLCIEPNPAFKNDIKRYRKDTIDYAISDFNDDKGIFNVVEKNGAFDSISALKIDERLIKDYKGYRINISTSDCKIRTLNYVIENFYKNKKIDFISIDVEGSELDVLKGFDINKYQPKLLVIGNIYNDIFVENYMKSFGYIKHNRNIINDFYVKENYITELYKL